MTTPFTTPAGIAFAAALATMAGPALAAADLVPVVTNLASGQAAVINLGDTPSAPGHMTVNCAKTMGAGGCPDDPVGMAPYEDAAYPNVVVIAVPALAPNESFAHEIAFFDGLVWTPGTYELTLSVDAGSATPEVNEANNTTSVEKLQLFGTGSAPVPKGPGTLTIGGQVGAQPTQIQAPAAGVQSLIGTVLGAGKGKKRNQR